MVKRLEELKKSLNILAGDVESQLSYLHDCGYFKSKKYLNDLTNVDELALQFEDVNYVTNGLLRDGLISKEAEALIKAVEAELTSYSGENGLGFWTIGGLRHDSRWSHIRNLAASAATSIDESVNR